MALEVLALEGAAVAAEVTGEGAVVAAEVAGGGAVVAAEAAGEGAVVAGAGSEVVETTVQAGTITEITKTGNEISTAAGLQELIEPLRERNHLPERIELPGEIDPRPEWGELPGERNHLPERIVLHEEFPMPEPIRKSKDAGIALETVDVQDAALKKASNAISSLEGIKDLMEKRPEKTEEPSVEEQQEVADTAAREYNQKYQPYERAVSKGVDDVTETANGGVSFENSKALYVDENNNKAIVQIEASGDRSTDFNNANKKFGLSETPDGYVWHHLDDYDVKSNTVTMQLVKAEAHDASKPHSGGCAQYDAVHGPTYNPPRKEV